MRIHQIATVTANDISDATLKAAPGRALTFLQGATDRRIHPKLLEVGFTTAVTDEALALIHKLSVVGTAPRSPPRPRWSRKRSRGARAGRTPKWFGSAR